MKKKLFQIQSRYELFQIKVNLFTSLIQFHFGKLESSLGLPHGALQKTGPFRGKCHS